MFENIISFFKKLGKKDALEEKSKDTAKERLQLVLMQDRANVSADFLDMMRQEIIEVIKKYIDVDESQIDVKLTNKTNEDGTVGAPALYANIPIAGIKEHLKNEVKPEAKSEVETETKAVGQKAKAELKKGESEAKSGAKTETKQEVKVKPEEMQETKTVASSKKSKEESKNAEDTPKSSDKGNNNENKSEQEKINNNDKLNQDETSENAKITEDANNAGNLNNVETEKAERSEITKEKKEIQTTSK